MAGPRAMTPKELEIATRRLAQHGPWARELKKAYRKVGTFAAQRARAQMRSEGDRRLALSARALKSDPWPTAAALRVSSTVQTSHGPRALVHATVWGTKGPTGWYRGGGRRQHPEWIGQSWRIATSGEGPRGINQALADNLNAIEDQVLDVVMSVVVRAFPAGTVR